MEYLARGNWEFYDAQRKVKSGDTVLLRQGTYSQTANLKTPYVTWRAYPGEVPTFDFGDQHGAKGQFLLLAEGITIRGLSFRCCQQVAIMAPKCTIRECYVSNAFASGGGVGGGGGAICVTAEGGLVENCVIENTGGNTQTNANGTIHDNRDHGIYVSASNAVIRGNYSGFSASGSAFQIGHGKGVLRNIVVDGNVFHSPGGNSPVVNLEGEDVIFRDNVVLSEGSQARALDFFWCPQRLILIDNVIASTGTAIRCAYGPDNGMATVFARRNRIYGEIVAAPESGTHEPLRRVEWLEGGMPAVIENNDLYPGGDLWPFPDAANRIRQVRKMIGA